MKHNTVCDWYHTDVGDCKKTEESNHLHKDIKLRMIWPALQNA